MSDRSHGSIKIKLNEAIAKSGQSKNTLTNLSFMQRTQFNNYCKGDIQRVDLDILARICHALGDCPVSDILEYEPPDGSSL